MSLINLFIDFILHIDEQLPLLVDTYHNYIYVILFLVIFCETGLVLTPFLPSDSLLFATATIASTGKINSFIIFPLFFLASVMGDNSNYCIGHFLSDRVLQHKKIPFVKIEHIDKTHKFFEIYGNKAIIIAKFMPIVRTLAPLIAGVGSMSYRKFIAFDLIACFLWVTVFYGMGLLVGKAIGNHFSIVVICIVIVSLIPAIFIFIKENVFKNKK
jgi:membrane-associated protein